MKCLAIAFNKIGCDLNFWSLNKKSRSLSIVDICSTNCIDDVICGFHPHKQQRELRRSMGINCRFDKNWCSSCGSLCICFSCSNLKIRETRRLICGQLALSCRVGCDCIARSSSTIYSFPFLIGFLSQSQYKLVYGVCCSPFNQFPSFK